MTKKPTKKEQARAEAARIIEHGRKIGLPTKKRSK